MRDAVIRVVMSALGIKRVDQIPLNDILKTKDLSTEVEQLEMDTLKALFRYTGKELRKRI